MNNLKKGDVILLYGIKWKVLFDFEDLVYGQGYRIQSLYNGDVRDLDLIEDFIIIPEDADEEMIKILYYE